ncbi:hypothetical protein D3C72_2142170 [compost metagenome]
MTNSCRLAHLIFSQLSLRRDTYGADWRLAMMPSRPILQADATRFDGVSLNASLKRRKSSSAVSINCASSSRRTVSGSSRRSRQPMNGRSKA